MKRFVNVLAMMAAVFVGASMLSACQNEGVGDPCTPENIPSDGFQRSEAYLETSSVQCRSRICLVNGLEGDPSCTKQSCANNDTACMMRCAAAQDIDDSVYCTCRCDGPAGTARFCDCPDGYECREIITSETAGAGIQGSYCVKPKATDSQ